MILLAGPEAGEILQAIFRPGKSHADSADNTLRLGHLADGEQLLDEAVVCSRGQSWEINIHGGPAVTKAAMELLVRRGAKALPSPAATHGLAHPKWNNPAIGQELADALPLARSELTLAALCHQWSGGISELARTVMDGDHSTQPQQALHQAASGLKIMHRLLHPPEVVLAGPPNAGKSTLANLLVGRQVSIVHEQPGTTRDWVRELAVIDGVPVYLTDTAGIWEIPASLSPLADHVDAEAVHRARQIMHKADLVLLLTPANAPDASHSILDALQTDRRPGSHPTQAVLRVTTKCDLHPHIRQADACISADTGEGIGSLRKAIRNALGLADLNPCSPLAFTARQADYLTQAAESLKAGDIASAIAALTKLLG